jgi:uncharacterized protein
MKTTKDFGETKEFLSYIVNKDYYKNLKYELKKYIQHGNTSIFCHSRSVAYKSYKLAEALEKTLHMKMDYESLICACYMHDFFGYDWHDSSGSHKLHGFTHPKRAALYAQMYCNATKKEQNMIKTHMWPLTITKIPSSKEAWILTICDKYATLTEVFH